MIRGTIEDASRATEMSLYTHTHFPVCRLHRQSYSAMDSRQARGDGSEIAVVIVDNSQIGMSLYLSASDGRTCERDPLSVRATY